MDRKSELAGIAQMRGGDVILTRLRWFEDSIVWAGRCDRREIARRFGVSRSQASYDIGVYMKVAPTNLRLLPDRRFYAASSSFEPVFPKNPRSFIETEQATSDGFALPIERRGDPWSRIEPAIIAVLTSAAVSCRPVSIVLLGGEDAVFCPYRLIDDGLSIEVRGWNHEHGEIRTYGVEKILRAVPDASIGWVGSEADVTHAPFRRSAEHIEGTAA